MTEEPREWPVRTPNVITTEKLTRTYGGDTGILDVDLSVPRGRVFGVVGPNGAGKTTLLSILAGTRAPASGRVRTDGGRILLCPDVPDFEPWLTASEVVALSARMAGADVGPGAVAGALDRVGLAEAADRRNGRFSRGMRQRLGLAAALVCRPDVLILDEPASGLDPQGRVDVLDLITSLRGECTVILASHLLGDVQRVCDDVVLLVRGRVVHQGPVSDIADQGRPAAWHVRVRERADHLAALLAAEGWVTHVSRVEADCVYLEAVDAAAGESGIPRLLAEHGVPLVAMSGHTPDLESMFLSLTNRTAR
ncbi:ABC transporter ATP-binding protein [Nocardiopsis sp. MG754419]|uniref:ABC transporter ATP-binding protein n=1 Tax=Nocardiopsis sp. MG754419 TaxID=2259865 RepID=UPI001BA7A731|nr:ABC transporter ATP-binding protein [Nocardiopsis sp. MG754419]MBR8744184.1 ABC transporter ATP-binding protein [Nocardiopsis sp. MG754419]